MQTILLEAFMAAGDSRFLPGSIRDAACRMTTPNGAERACERSYRFSRYGRFGRRPCGRPESHPHQAHWFCL